MWTIPNLLTFLRLLLVPVFLWFATRGTTGGAVTAGITFLVAGLTDTLDGWVARRYDSDSDLGRFLDPLADKLLVLSALYWAALGFGAARSWFSIWFVHLIAVREIAITGLRTVRRLRGRQVITASEGKLKTTLQIITIALVLVFEAAARVMESVGWSGAWIDSAPIWWLVQIFFASAVIMTVISGVRYFTVNAATMPVSAPGHAPGPAVERFAPGTDDSIPAGDDPDSAADDSVSADAGHGDDVSGGLR